MRRKSFKKLNIILDFEKVSGGKVEFFSII